MSSAIEEASVPETYSQTGRFRQRRAAQARYRRINWIERAIEPLRDNLDDSGFERLVSALAMVIG